MCCHWADLQHDVFVGRRGTTADAGGVEPDQQHLLVEREVEPVARTVRVGSGLGSGFAGLEGSYRPSRICSFVEKELTPF